MTKTISRAGVKPARDIPKPKQSGIIRKTKEWTEATAKIGLGMALEIRLPDSLNALVKSPNDAFMAALKRKYRRTYQIYAREGVIYALPKDGK